MLISELLLQLQELLFFALLDGIVLVGLLALLKGVTINSCLSASSNDHSGAWEGTLGLQLSEVLQYHRWP